jgi:Flp pilus assembly protein CpaB
MSRLLLSLRRLRRVVLARRRPLAALCAAVAVVVALQANAAPAPPRTMVWTAAHDLPGGIVVRTNDLHRTAFDSDSVPSGILGTASDAVGRTTAGPVRAGEPLTDARLVTSTLLDGYPGLVALPVRIADAAAVQLLRVGDRIDVLAADPQGEPTAAVVGHAVPVLAIPRSSEATPEVSNGALVVLGVSLTAARTIAQAGVSSVISVVLTR